jgi:hypothetical protein
MNIAKAGVNAMAKQDKANKTVISTKLLTDSKNKGTFEKRVE